MKAVAREKPDLIIGSGDLSEDASPESYALLQGALSPLNIPYHLMPGNHDLLHELEFVFGDKAKADAKLNLNGWTLLLLNSVVQKQAYGLLSEQTLAFLEEALRTAPGNVGVFLHHHPVPISNEFMNRYALKNGDQFTQIVEAFDKIKFVAFGHIHQAFSSKVQQIHYLGTPATSLQFKLSQNEVIVDNEAGPGYRVFHLNENSFDTSVEILSA